MEAIKKDELFDEELCGMVKFTDATTKPTQPAKTEKKTANKEPVKEKKVAKKTVNEPMDAEYEPVKTWYDEKTVNMVKWVVVFVALEYLFFYWQQTGQMEPSAAVPCMMACTTMVGVTYGRVFAKEMF
jgi:hypothetical protein